MAAHKQGIFISQLVYNVDVQFQLLYQCFIRLRNFAELFLILYNASGRQQSKMAGIGGQQTGNTYISACVQLIYTIPTAILIFSRSGNSIKLFSIMCNAKERQQFKMAARMQEILMFASRHLGFLT